MENAFVFIDGAYLSLVSKYFGKGKYLKIDLFLFANYLASKQNLVCSKLFYYTAPPYQSSQPTIKENKLKAGYDSFINKIKSNHKIVLREGRLQKLGDNEFAQKGVDTLITMDLMEAPLRDNLKTIILLTSDTDFVPILNKLRNDYKIKIILYYFTDRIRNSGFSMSNYILTACDIKVLLKIEDFYNCRR